MGNMPESSQLYLLHLAEAAVLCYHLTMNFLFPMFATLLCIYMAFKTKWAISFLLLYFVWMLYDWKSPRQGGYSTLWFRKLSIQKYMATYFPMKLHKTVDLSPNENYLIVSHPHGIMALGSYINFCTNATGVFEMFPSMNIKICTLVLQFWIPIRREWTLLHGLIDCSKDSLQYMLDVDRSKGNMVVLVPGGAEEALDAHPGKHILTLRNRKGFIRMALLTGANLVPTYIFGENELYVQKHNPKGSNVRKWQEAVKKRLGMSTPLVHGRGIFNSKYGAMPYKKPVNAVVGVPIRVIKTKNPSDEEVDQLHEQYVNALCALFETNKRKYGVDEDVRLIIQ